MANSKWNQNGSSRSGEALPQPIQVKKEMLRCRTETQEAASDFAVTGTRDDYDRWRTWLIRWQQRCRSYIKRQSKKGSQEYEVLGQIRGLIKKPGRVVEPGVLLNFTEKLDDLMYEIGVTNIGTDAVQQPYGYEFLNGLPFNMSTTDSGYHRLIRNMKNLRKLMRDDVDVFGLFTGPNRTGKTTLNMKCSRVLKSGRDTDCLTRENFVFTPGNLQETSEELGQYGVMIGDEGSKLFYSGDAMKKEQKSAKKLLKTYATRNQALLVSDTQFYRLDKEVITDKCKFEVHIPSRGKFEFYSKAKIQQYDKDRDTGEAVRPEPDFTGRFDALSGKDWELYQELEEQKIEGNGDGSEGEGDDGDGDGFDAVEMAEDVVEDPQVWKEYGDRLIVDLPKLEAYYGLSEPKAKQVKAVAEDAGAVPDVEREVAGEVS